MLAREKVVVWAAKKVYAIILRVGQRDFINKWRFDPAPICHGVCERIFSCIYIIVYRFTSYILRTVTSWNKRANVKSILDYANDEYASQRFLYILDLSLMLHLFHFHHPLSKISQVWQRVAHLLCMSPVWSWKTLCLHYKLSWKNDRLFVILRIAQISHLNADTTRLKFISTLVAILYTNIHAHRLE